MGANEVDIQQVHDLGIDVLNREIFINPSFGSEENSGIDFRCSSNYVKNIITLNKSDGPILVHLHVSNGGDWIEGMAMFDSTRLSANPVTFIAYADISSMTGILLQSADYRWMTPNAEFMIHYGSIEISGNSLEATAANDFNHRTNSKMLRFYSNRAINGPFFVKKGYTKKKIESYINRMIKKHSDWYFDAQQAVDYGFADGILERPISADILTQEKFKIE